jgi:hypothetical protein
MFLECKYDGWGIHVTNGTAFPRNCTDIEGFAIWISHFHSCQKNECLFEPAFDYNDYNCYNPANMQARYMTCKMSENSSTHYAHHLFSKSEMEPNLTKALQGMQKIDMIGITDFYYESLCLLFFKVHLFVPDWCLCSAEKKLHTNHIQHGVPKHSVTDIDAESTAKIMSLTRIDNELYLFALKRFSKEILAIENSTGQCILRDQIRAQLIKSTTQ